MPKYVFCDLDYTLLNNNREISKSNFDEICNFESKGNRFIICSGRVPFALKQYSDYLKSKDVVTSNGAIIIKDGKIIKEHYLTENIIIPITKYAIKHNINVRFFTKEYLIVINQEFSSVQSFMYPGSKIIDKANIFDVIKNEKIIKMVFSSDNRKLLEETGKAINEMNLDVELSFSSDIFLEVNALNQNKGNGILEYCKINNVKIEDTVAIGDNENDLSMIKVAGFSACPSNSIEDVKKLVNYVCVNDNDHDAVKEVLERLMKYE